MPHEILYFHYIPLPSLPPIYEIIDVFADGGQPDPQPPEQPLVYNFQHDLESLWWIFLWTVLSRVPHQASVMYGKTIFQNTMILSAARSQCFLEEIGTHLEQCLHSPLKLLSAPLEMLRRIMHSAYVERRRDGKLTDIASYVAVHRCFVQFFNRIKTSQATWGGTALVTHRPSVASSETFSKPSRHKRLRDDNAYVPSSGRADVPRPTRNKQSRDDDAYVPEAEDKRDKRGRHR